jgi:hypothetical protein
LHHALKEHRAKPHIIAKRGLCGVREWFHPHANVVAFIKDWPKDIEDALAFEPLSLGKEFTVSRMRLKLSDYFANGSLVGFPTYSAREFAEFFGVSEAQGHLIAADHAALLDFDFTGGIGVLVAENPYAFLLAMEMRERYGLSWETTLPIGEFFIRLVDQRREFVRLLAAGVETRVWGGSCCKLSGHGAVDGADFDLAEGFSVDGRPLLPGTSLGCSCYATDRSVREYKVSRNAADPK